MAYSAFKYLLDIIISAYFRHIDVVGAPRIPETGPVIFVANHANQFLDPMMLIVHVKRVVRFLIAEKSLKRFVIGDIARGVRTIGVERPQDLAKKGTGTVSGAEDSTTVTGDGTSFTKQLSEGSKLKVGDLELAITSVESDTSCTIKGSHAAFAGKVYKALPYVDQNAVYSKVHEALRKGDCVGIFPEGGSHDQAGMLELKPGVAIMALGAIQAGAGDVQICPCGLNYFEPYRFRSRVVVEFGNPISVPPELAEQYKTDKRGAVAALMHLIENSLMALRPGAENYEELSAIITMRALWKPQGRKLTPEQSVKITRSLALGIRMFKDDERIPQILREVEDYNRELKAVGCVDRDVRMNAVTSRVFATRATRAFLVAFLLAIPTALFSIVLAPIAYITYRSAVREKKNALAASNVKVKALDVVASQKVKIGLVVVPIYTFFLNLLIMWASGTGWTTLLFLTFVWTPLCVSFGLRMCDHFWGAVSVFSHILFSHRAKSMLDKRAELQRRVRELVEEFGPKVVEDFSKKRTFSAEELARDTIDSCGGLGIDSPKSSTKKTQ